MSDDLILDLPTLEERLRELVKQGDWTGDHPVIDEVLSLDRSFRQACMNLATIRPDPTRDGFTLADQAGLWHDALMAGWGGIEGYDPGRKPAEIE